MKSLRVLLTTIFISFLFSCKNKSAEPDQATSSRKGDSALFIYPITDYIQSQLAYVDTMPLAIEKQTFINNRRVDSVIIDRPTFKQLAQAFTTPSLDDSSISSRFTLSKFQDLTINTLTFSYNSVDPNMELQQKDVLLDPETQRVKNILFRKIEHHGDTTITINGLWKHNLNFQLNYLIEPANGPMESRQVKVIWDRPIE